jgi:type IV secretory pathway VirB10-like protein
MSSNQEAFATFLDRADAGSSLIIFTTVEMVMPPPPTKEQIAEAQAQQAAIAQQQRQQQMMQRASSPPADEQADGENYDPDAAVHDPDAPAPTEVDTSAEDAARAAEIEAAMLSLAREPVPTLKLHLTSQCLPESMVNNLGRTMYFIKNVDKVAPLPEETVQAAMSRSLEYSVLPSQSLFTLESVIKNIYLPIFEPEQV